MAATPQWLRSRAGYGGLVLLSASLALALYLYSTSTGLAGTADTYHYLYAAQALRQTGRLLMPDGSLYQFWPPLYATVLRTIGVPGPVRWLHGAALVGALVAWSITGRQLLPAGRAWVLPLLLALGSPVLVVSKFIWSEALFSLLWAGYYLVLLAWLRHGGWALGLLATGLGCLLPLQRIAGVFLLLGVGAGLAWPGAGRLVRPGRWAQLGHLVGTASGLLGWQLHLWLSAASGALTRPDLYRGQLVSILADYGFVLGRWLLPLPTSSLGIMPGAVWGLVLGGILTGLWPNAATMQPAPKLPANWVMLSARIFFVGLLLMLIALVASTLAGRIDRGGLGEAERYLTALYPPFVLLVLLAWPTRQRWATRWGPVLAIAWIGYQGARAGHNAYQLRQLPPADTAIQLKLPQ